ncbi:MAG: response regulator [Planctomycetes bacterium]|nr:response regulator [Planctomycetota bacterium]
MNIKIRTGVLVALCTITGYSLGSILVYGYQDVQAQTMATGPNSGALKDVDRLKDLLAQWLLLTDLVMNDGETYVLNASSRQSRELEKLLGELRKTPLCADKTESLVRIEHGIKAIQGVVEDSTILRGGDRASRINDMVAQVDEFAAPLVRMVEDLETQLVARSKHLQRDVEESRASLLKLSILFSILYLLIIGLAWSWNVRTTVRPIEDLSLAAERANLTRSEFDVEEAGPEEVRRLTRNISAFVSRLEAAQEATEKEVVDRTAQLVKANRAKSEFLATMSHELRTPLNGIISMNSLILDTELDREQVEYARTAKSAAEALLGIINDILDFSKIEAKKLKLEHLVFDVRQIVESTTDIISGIAESKGIDLAAIVSSEVPGLVVGDPTRVRQVLMNLLNNAVKFTEHGRIVVRVSLPFRKESGESVLRFEVRDTGIGIPADRKDTLFQVFEQADSTTTRRFGGTGLGLAISRELSHLMGGDIGVDSEFGVGSCFWFTVQVDPSREPCTLALPVATLARKVVVFSDRELIREQLKESLISIGIDPNSTAIFGMERDIAVIPDDFRSPDVCLYVIVDSDGQRDRAWSIQNALSNHESKPEIAVIEHLLRRREIDVSFDNAELLLEPLKTSSLRDWILSSYSGDPKTHVKAIASEKLTGKVLVAEDNLINQKVARKVLERVGLTVTVVNDGREALLYVTENPCDLILMDCQMPVMDGWQSARLIRELEADGKLDKGCPARLPIVACTANAQESDRKRCLDAGMDDFVSKPFKLKDLIDTMRKHLT